MTSVDVNCSDEVNTFESQVDLEFQGDFDAVTQLERNATERGFRITYNDLTNSTLCDPLFRRVTNAEIILAEEIAERRDRSLQARFFRFRFLVAGDCRGCERKAPLFDDASGRRAIETIHLGPHGRQLQDTAQCTCGNETVDEARPPTTGEYTDAYNVWLIKMHDKGTIDPEHIETLLETRELTTSGSFRMMSNHDSMVVGQLSLMMLFVLKLIF